MAGFKRDYQGNAKKFEGRGSGPKSAPKPTVTNTYTPMFEKFRDELDEHHDRRDRMGKASRDITALSKKIIFALQRVRQIHPTLPPDITSQLDQRLSEIAVLLASIAPELQELNRYRYARQLSCLEELVEALTFAHYLRTQQLIGRDELAVEVDRLCRAGKEAMRKDEKRDEASGGDTVMGEAGEKEPKEDVKKEEEQAPTVSLTVDDYLFGVFDLTGEMMRFATTAGAASIKAPAVAMDIDVATPRTIVKDMQDLGSFFEMLPRRHDKSWQRKMETLVQSVRKVERLGYNRVVRGSERPDGWMPDLEEVMVGGEEE